MYDKDMNQRIIDVRLKKEQESAGKICNNPELPEDKNPGLSVKARKRRRTEDILIAKQIDESFSLESSL